MTKDMDGLEKSYIYTSAADPALPRFLRTTVTKQVKGNHGEIVETKFVDVLVPLDRVIRFEDDTKVDDATVIITELRGRGEEDEGGKSGKTSPIYCLYSMDDLDTIMDAIKEAWMAGKLIADPEDLAPVEEPLEITP